MPELEPERFQFKSADGLSIACVKWSGCAHKSSAESFKSPMGSASISGRYAELAETLVHREFVVYGNDHRGHGLTAKPSGSFGDFGPGGFDQLVEDMVSLESHRERTSTQANLTSCSATVWVLSPRNNFFSSIVIQSTA